MRCREGNRQRKKKRLREKEKKGELRRQGV